MRSHEARELSEEEVATLVTGLTMLLNENAAYAAKTSEAGEHGDALAVPEQELLVINARQQEVVTRLLSELETGPLVTFDPR